MSTVTATESLPTEVASLLIPMPGRALLLPNVAVAEIIPFDKPEPDHGTPDWHVGTLAWRGINVPIVSIDAINGRKEKGLGENPRIAVINGVGDHPELPFYGFVVAGIPRLVRVFEQEIGKEKKKTGAAESMLVQVGGESAVILDLDFIESKILGN